jgi:CDGSH-type Zn-finger protein
LIVPLYSQISLRCGSSQGETAPWNDGRQALYGRYLGVKDHRRFALTWKTDNNQERRIKEFEMTEADNRAAKYKIKVTKNGPYVVTGGVPLSERIIGIDKDNQSHGWNEGKKYPVQGAYALCRCGESANKPFCDGSHIKIHFDGTETASQIPYLNQAEEIVGSGLKLTDAQAFCANARFCDRAGGYRTLMEHSGDPEARKTAIEEACDCPSGRLVAWDKGGKAIEPDFEPSIGLVMDTQENKMGPLWVRGGIPIESADGSTYEIRNRVTLCRCGKSSNNPFCDGSHLK